jgi:hypothetical protein
LPNLTLARTFRKQLRKARKTLFAVSIVAIMFLTASRARSEEKHWIAHEASLIVVGTLHPHITFPWLDGWHFTGTIDVDEVLFGSRPGAHIDYRFVCKYAWCRTGPLPSFPSFYRAKGIWCLRLFEERFWQPSTGFGFVVLSARTDFEDYIRRYKQTSSH